MTDLVNALELRNVSKAFGETAAVAGVSLQVKPHEIVALVGPSGCGKSTLLRLVAGLLQADSGSITLNGALVDDGREALPPERRSAGLVFQEHALFPHLTVAENVGFGLRGLDGTVHTERVADMLDLVDLGGYDERYPHELSGGERQRVALARALAPAPEILLLDEPFASLDFTLRSALRTDVVNVLRQTGTPAVFVTHDQREALAIGDRIAVMRDGQLAQVGDPESVFHRPVDRFVGEFMGEASFLSIHESSDGPASVLGPVEVAGGERLDVLVAMVRPDDIAFEPDIEGGAEIVSAEYSGSSWLARAALDDGSHVSFQRSHLVEPKVGDRGAIRLVDGHRQVVVRRRRLN